MPTIQNENFHLRFFHVEEATNPQKTRTGGTRILNWSLERTTEQTWEYPDYGDTINQSINQSFSGYIYSDI